MEKKILGKLDRKKTLQSLGVSLLVAFTFCIFGPLELYYSNASELWFLPIDMVISTIPVFILLFCCSMIILLLFKGKGYRNAIALMLGGGIALYVQGNLMNVNYGSLNGTEIDWSKYKVWAFINTAIWIILILGPVFFANFKKLKETVFDRIVTAVPLFLVALQVVTLTTLILMNTNTSKNEFYLSNQDKFELSKNKNVIVFVLDTFDGGLFSEIIEKHPDYKDKFSDFTYFENTLSAYPRTKGALPFILTGKYNENTMPFSDYIKDSYQKTDFYRDLAANGFDTRIYTQLNFVDGQQNKVINNIIQEQPQVSSHVKLSELMYRLTAYRYMPHLLKQNFWMYSGDFEQLKTFASNEEKNYNILSTDGQYSQDYNFYREMLDKGIGDGNNMNTFRLYHLNGVHVPFNINEKIEYAANGTATEEGQALAVLNIVSDYIDQLKKLGIYDNTTFIVLGDHGYRDMSQNPMLMVKKAGQHESFTTSNAPVSQEDLQATIMQQVTGDYKKYGRSVFDISESESRERRYLLYQWIDDSNQNYLLPLTEYSFSGNANDISSARKTGQIYTKDGILQVKVPTYTFGKVLSFGNDNEAQQYFEYGISNADDGAAWAWSLGSRSKIVIPLEKKPESDVKVRFDIAGVLNDNQSVKIYINGSYMGEQNVTTSLDILVPNHFVQDKQLEIVLEYSDAQTANRINSENQDFRTIAIMYKSMVINTFELQTFSDKTLVIGFNKGGNSESFIESGWWEQEDQHRWVGKEASIIYKMDTPQNIKMSMDYFTFPESGETEVYYNGTKIGNVSIDGGSTTMFLPAKYFNDNGIQRITFKAPGAVSPKSIKKNEDSRVLSIGVKTLKLEKVDKSSIPALSDQPLTIGFEKDGNNTSFIENGWWEQEETHRWAAKEASIIFRMDAPQDIEMSIEYFSLPESGETEVYYNGTKIDSLKIDEKQKTIILPAKYCIKDDIQRISFKTPSAISPKSIGKNEDTRILSFGVTKIKLEKSLGGGQ